MRETQVVPDQWRSHGTKAGVVRVELRGVVLAPLQLPGTGVPHREHRLDAEGDQAAVSHARRRVGAIAVTFRALVLLEVRVVGARPDQCSIVDREAGDELPSTSSGVDPDPVADDDRTGVALADLTFPLPDEALRPGRPRGRRGE